ncbi:MAG: SUMF1/EgtB/PvdO family nonheme iron enzyme [Nitrospinae bacterium]|nr:SUMF1/EgtB/PvdO family nonheme iron enzyme [Nitrospinota bacterium]
MPTPTINGKKVFINAPLPANIKAGKQVMVSIKLDSNSVSGKKIIKIPEDSATVLLAMAEEAKKFLTENGFPHIAGTDFHISKTEITESQFDECVNNGYCMAVEDKWDSGPNYPRIDINNYDVKKYADFFTKKQLLPSLREHLKSKFPDQVDIIDGINLDVNLPSEAEWETATRHADPSKGNVNSGKMTESCASDDFSSDGVCDLVGNLAEWVGEVNRDRPLSPSETALVKGSDYSGSNNYPFDIDRGFNLSVTFGYYEVGGRVRVRVLNLLNQ